MLQLFIFHLFLPLFANPRYLKLRNKGGKGFIFAPFSLLLLLFFFYPALSAISWMGTNRRVSASGIANISCNTSGSVFARLSPKTRSFKSIFVIFDIHSYRVHSCSCLGCVATLGTFSARWQGFTSLSLCEARKPRLRSFPSSCECCMAKAGMLWAWLSMCVTCDSFSTSVEELCFTI